MQHIHLWIIGDNVVSDGKGIEKKNTDNITFLGWIPHEDVPAYYEACDAVIMPSRWEAFGLVAIEAMKYGKPVIVSNRGALPELVQDGMNGWVFNMGDKSDLVSVLQNVNTVKCNKLGQIGIDVYQKMFCVNNMLNKMACIYQV